MPQQFVEMAVFDELLGSQEILEGAVGELEGILGPFLEQTAAVEQVLQHILRALPVARTRVPGRARSWRSACSR